MGYRIEDDCVGCDYCRDCGRKHIKVHFCDKCETYADEWNPLYYSEEYGEVCWDCYKEQFLSKCCDDMDETQCANCGAEAEIMYLCEGEWVCESCLQDLAEKVED